MVVSHRNAFFNLKFNRSSQNVRTRSLYSWIVRGVACLLLFSAGMKAWQLATTFVSGEGILHSKGLNILVVEAELALGFWLFSGLLPRITRIITIGLFSIFVIVSLFKAISGEASCGCFGKVQVNPWLTLVLDLTVIYALIIFGKKQLENGVVSFWKIFQVVSLWTIITLPFLYALANRPGSIVLNGNDANFNNVQYVTLEPKSWLGKECPILDVIEINETIEKPSLNHGEWNLLLVHNSCFACQNLIQFISESPSHTNFEKLVFIEIPDDESPSFPVTLKKQIRWFGTLKKGPVWFAPSPVLLQINNRVVTSVHINTNVEAFFQKDDD